MNKEFYDGSKLLSLTDLDGNKPEIFICTSNRSAGKTTYFNRYALNRFLKQGEKFILLYRYKYEVADCAGKFFNEIGNLFFTEYEMKCENKVRGLFAELFIRLKTEDNSEKWMSCGYACAVNSADMIKKYSHLLSEGRRLIFDEFQTENGVYCDKEVSKFISLHTSLARGGGSSVRYLPVIMISNPVSILNPYYTELRVHERLTKNTKVLRGHGWVLETSFNESVATKQLCSAFNKAFANNSYTSYARDGEYLNDSLVFIEKISGNNRYVCTIKDNGKDYAIRWFPETDIYYCDTSVDPNATRKIAVCDSDHSVGYNLTDRLSVEFLLTRKAYADGRFRFRNIECRNAVMSFLKY